MSVKICIIGAGSAMFSVGLVKDICITDNLNGTTVALMDVNEERLDNIYGLCKRYSEETNANINIIKTTDRREAMKGADFVLNVALDFGHERFKQAIDVAYNNGYHFGGSLHVVHDESFSINFYQLRLMESVLADMLDICPDAYYILVANPVQGGVTYLQRKYKDAKIVGMCHGFNGVNAVFDAMGLDAKHVTYEIAGVNHFIWMTKFFYKGENAYPMLDKWLDENYEEFSKNLGISAFMGKKPVDLYKKFGLFPIGDTANPGGGAWGWWYHSDDEVEKEYNENPYLWYQHYFENTKKNVERIDEIVHNLDKKVSETIAKGHTGEPMIPLIEGLACDVENKVIVNVLNSGGYMKGLPTDYEVEIAAMVSKNGVCPIHNEGLPKPIMAHLMRDRIAPVEVELAAFENRSRDLLVDLIMMDPWTKSKKQAEKLLDDILNLPCNADMKEYYR